MGYKKYTVFFLLSVFLMARVEPVFPYLKTLPQLTHNIISHLSALYTGSTEVNILANIDIEDQDNTDTKDDEKETEKEVTKSIKEECKMLLHDYTALLIFNQSSNRTLFHLYLSGKERTHVNEVFRPPLV
ncbi:hypothetical protein [Mucilaginibacter paludis]|uniref:Uncharacterized protein n=1 Tax=Mucilaginibacter paludis DSM 18603 TaxID=714943 RepID=H1Y302_9SPHI|nr:hypothetical protein [Mucilaginibacter paludis]EHQ28547.1 hypothetical protein Mucpa_4457 [Mucilaginibacter paludis DSM 18603]